jgi:hypothetical protein
MLLLSRHGAVTRPIASRFVPALCALAATVLLGVAGPHAPGAWELLESPGWLPAIGIIIAGAVGLLACHLAQLSVAPFPAATTGMLPAALLAAALPGIATPALLVPLAVSAHMLARHRREALCGLAGVLAGLVAAWLQSPEFATVASFALLAAATLLIRNAEQPAANDNAGDERSAERWIVPDGRPYVTQPARTASPERGE